jgi:hypothetical protein
LTDGFTLFRCKKSDVWPICAIVHNLPDEVQTRQENILILALIPGPSTPKDFDLFLNPIVEEFIELAHSIPAFDASMSKVFTMHAFPTTIFGDMLAICKVMRFNGSNGECPCRECLIIGVLLWCQHYFPHTMPSNHPLLIDPEPSDSDDMEGHVKFWLYEQVPQTDDNYQADYDVLDLLLRNHTCYLKMVRITAGLSSSKDQEQCQKATGIKGLSILARLGSIDFPRSFPHNIMHLLFLNVTKNMLNLWTDKYKNLNKYIEQFHISDNIYKRLCGELENCHGTFPSQFGRPFPDLYNRPADFTAENWLSFVTLTSSIVLHNHLLQDCLENWNVFVKATKLCIKLEITCEDVHEIRQLFADFVTEYKK